MVGHHACLHWHGAAAFWTAILCSPLSLTSEIRQTQTTNINTNEKSILTNEQQPVYIASKMATIQSFISKSLKTFSVVCSRANWPSTSWFAQNWSTTIGTLWMKVRLTFTAGFPGLISALSFISDLFMIDNKLIRIKVVSSINQSISISQINNQLNRKPQFVLTEQQQLYFVT